MWITYNITTATVSDPNSQPCLQKPSKALATNPSVVNSLSEFPHLVLLGLPLFSQIGQLLLDVGHAVIDLLLLRLRLLHVLGALVAAREGVSIDQVNRQGVEEKGG